MENAGEWTRRVETSKEEIPGSKRSMYGYNYTDLPQALKGKPSSSVFSTDGTLISASAAPHCGGVNTKVHPKKKIDAPSGMYPLHFRHTRDTGVYRHTKEPIFIQDRT